MGFDLFHNPLYPLHHLGKIKIDGGLFQAKLVGPPPVIENFCTTDQGLARHTAGVEAVTPHFIAFDQGDPGLHRRSDIGADQTGGSCPKDDNIVVKAFRPGMIFQSFTLFQHVHSFTGQQWKNSKQGKRQKQPRRQNPPQALDLTELGTGIDVNSGAGQHPDLADPVVGPGAHGGQAHDQVDDKEGKQGHQPQGKQIESPLFVDAVINGLEATSKLALDPVAQEKAADQKSQGGADGTGERHNDKRRPEPEQSPAGQGHDGGTG